MKIPSLIAALATLWLGAGAAFAGSAEKGKEVFARTGCWQCHGYEGQGGSAGARVANTALSEEGLIAFVRGTSGAMPPFSTKLISDEELSDVFAYLQSRPKPADPGAIPLLSR
jgi:mono/diheme cytochrome c family protein